MPMLNWMGREKAAKATKDVVMKILREEKSLSYCGGDILTQSRRGAENAGLLSLRGVSESRREDSKNLQGSKTPSSESNNLIPASFEESKKMAQAVLKRGQIAESIPYDVLAAYIWWQETGRGWNVFNAESQRRREGEGNKTGALPQTPKNLDNPVNPVKKKNSASLRLCVENKKSPVLGIHDGVAYALLYNGILHDRSVNGGNVLTRQTLGVIKNDLADAQERVPPKDAAGGSRSCATEYRRLVVYGEWNKLGEERLKDEKIEFRQTPYDVVTRR